MLLYGCEGDAGLPGFREFNPSAAPMIPSPSLLRMGVRGK